MSSDRKLVKSFHAEVKADPATIVIFGASGDLTGRKLIPALYTLWREGYLPQKTPIVGVARRPKTDEEFRAELARDAREHARPGLYDAEAWNQFAQRVFYYQLDITDQEGYAGLDQQLGKLEKAAGTPGNRLIYLATDPSLFLPVIEGLSRGGFLSDERSENWLRVVIEKPFGHDLESARQLNQTIGRLLREDQIYRIDHYLGKETVQNLLLFRFGNAIFEPLLNRNHVDHVQITVAESQGIEEGRGGYYDRVGALRDVLQNHVLQLLALIAMEPPVLFRAKDIHDEKVKVLQALTPGDPNDVSKWAIGGQYTPGVIDGKAVRGYREEDRVDPKSRRDAFVAMETYISNWRWADVPFYIRTGKRLPARVSEIAVTFKLPPLHLFTTVECEGDLCDLVSARPNTLIFRIQPFEAISLTISTKRPGMQWQLQQVPMEFRYDSAFEHGLPEAYERLLLDVLRGDSTLFTRSDELEAAWQFVMPALQHFDSPKFEPDIYRAGSWGPPSADQLLAKSGRAWRHPSPDTKGNSRTQQSHEK